MALQQGDRVRIAPRKVSDPHASPEIFGTVHYVYLDQSMLVSVDGNGLAEFSPETHQIESAEDASGAAPR
ncbi:MAG: hypothetical protein WD851_05115 [Pirellulales bacterium]